MSTFSSSNESTNYCPIYSTIYATDFVSNEATILAAIHVSIITTFCSAVFHSFRATFVTSCCTAYVSTDNKPDLPTIVFSFQFSYTSANISTDLYAYISSF
jgi:hypothetical protein